MSIWQGIIDDQIEKLFDHSWLLLEKQKYEEAIDYALDHRLDGMFHELVLEYKDVLNKLEEYAE